MDYSPRSAMAVFTQNVSADYLPVAEFFRDRSIFVTGGTGFMGKVLVEKLLRSCPGIKNIYLLMRPKRGQDVHARLAEITDLPLFDQVRKERPWELKKIIPIMGDVTEPQLGISQSDRNLLISNVSVVFHSAATVKFDEALKLSVAINMLGTKRLIELCHQMLGLEALIHVSTAYCNCDRFKVDEVVYPPPFDPEKIIECMEWMDDDLIDIISPKLIGSRPNTYTLTKAMAEHMLMKESGRLPVAIVRPSIVLSTLKKPVAGWIDNWNGPTGLLAAASKGLFRTMYCQKNGVVDLIPVDVVINLMIVAAWRIAMTRPDKIQVYNCVSGIQKPITWSSFINQCRHYIHKHPLHDLVWFPDGNIQNNRLINDIRAFSLHKLPAYIMDAWCRLTGKKPIMVKVLKKIDKGSKCLEYFTSREWQFYDDNVKHLNSILSNEDKQTFYFDVREIDWPQYLEDYILGIRSFIFKECPSSLPTARKQARKLLLIHRIAQVAGCVFLLRLFHVIVIKNGGFNFL